MTVKRGADMGVSNLPLMVLTGNQESFGLFLVLFHSATVSEKKEEDATWFAGHKFSGIKVDVDRRLQLQQCFVVTF